MLLRAILGLLLAADVPPPSDAVPAHAAGAPPAAEVKHSRIAREHVIAVSNAAPFYAPATLTIRAGETVHWRSGTHSDTHSVREALHGTFSLDIPPGGEVTYLFRRSGEYQYQCRYHPWMIGRIVVEPRRLDVDWQPLPDAMRNGRVVARDDEVFFVGRGARPDIARLEHGKVTGSATLKHRIAPDVAPAISADGSLWFAGDTAGTIVQFSPRTGASSVFATQAAALNALAAATDGTLWFYDRQSQRIGRFNPAGSSTSWIFAVDIDKPPLALRAGADGVIWLASADGQKILRLDRAGAVVEFTIPPAIGTVRGFVPAHDGVWILDDAGNIARLAEAGFERFVVAPRARHSVELVAGRRGELWLLDAEERRIGHIAPEVRTLAPLQ